MNLKAWCEGWGIATQSCADGSVKIALTSAQFDGLGEAGVQQLENLDDYAPQDAERLSRGGFIMKLVPRKSVGDVAPTPEPPKPKWYLPVSLYDEEMNYIEELAEKLTALGVQSDGKLCLHRLLRYFKDENNEAYQATRAVDENLPNFRYK